MQRSHTTWRDVKVESPGRSDGESQLLVINVGAGKYAAMDGSQTARFASTTGALVSTTKGRKGCR